MNPSRIFIERPIATFLIMLAIFISGFLAFQLLPISSLPEVDYPTIKVSTTYPGASPEVMASIVTVVLEKQFGQMPGLLQMTSSSSYGLSLITLQFSLDMNLDVAEQEVQAAINAATNFLPNDLPYPPIYSKVNPADFPILTIALTSKAWPLYRLQDLAETKISPKLSQVLGVGLVTLSGGQRPAVRVQVNSKALSSYGLTLEDVRTAINNSNVNLAKGNFDGESLAYNINANDQLLKSESYKTLIIAYRNDAPIRLMDVALVLDDVENSELAAWYNEQSAIILNIQRQPGSNIIQVSDRIKTLLPTLIENLPKAIDVSILSDRTQSIRNSISEAKFELMISIFLVVMIIFLFLRHFYSAIIPSIAVPLSLVGTFAFMLIFGFSLNNLTLMALTIATGFVVDDAIVMIENITRYIEQGKTAVEAALIGSKQIAFTIISLTFSLIAVLIPLFFMQEMMGRLFREFASTLAITILISAFVSLTLTPMLCSQLLNIKKNKNNLQNFNTANHYNVIATLIRKYGESLKFVFAHQTMVLLIALLILILTILLFMIIPKGLFPTQDTGMILGITEAKEAISYPSMKIRQEEVVKRLLEDPAVDNVSSLIGIDGINTTLNRGRILINLKPLDHRREKISETMARLKNSLEAISGISLYLRPVQEFAIEDQISLAQYQYSISAMNQEDLVLWSDRFIEQLKKKPIFTEVENNLQMNGLQAYLNIDRDSAARLGINTSAIDETLYDAFGQRQISTIYTQFNQYRVILELHPGLKKGPEALQNVYLNSSTNGSIPFANFTTAVLKKGPSQINRQGQFPVNLISFNLASNAHLAEAIRVVNQIKEDLNLPMSIQTGFEGAAKIFSQSLNNEIWLLLSAIIVVYIILGILYESMIHPVTILSTLPSATLGALLGLMITGNELSVIALIGIILLIGIVMKNAILMIDFALECERKQKKSPIEAIYEASLLRFRPILMTTLAAMFGALPIVFSGGMGNEIRKPLGIVIFCGLLFSQILTLYTTPIIYLAFDRLSKIKRTDFFRLNFKNRNDGTQNEPI